MAYNRLSNEKSPYLAQHAENPVDWYPWGEEAFEQAKRADKPIFLSIGYSTCHWCHVMAHESFEDNQVAALMNEAFVNVKVDREERPDVDNVYMSVCLMMTQRGGWPLTIIMTPDKIPFFAATYIPKESRFGLMGMIELATRIKTLWATKRNDLVAMADKVFDTLKQTSEDIPEESPDESILKQGFRQLSSSFDEQFGGFSDSPKFPTPHNMLFLLRRHARDGSAGALEMVEKTLFHMRLGGMYDHVGFGFHRYSTDAHWFVPHFEKMLYDQAMLAMAYTETYQATLNPFYSNTAREILSYVLRDMTHPEGGFYSAEDADSEGKEGRFYLWHQDELTDVLGETDASLAARIFNVEKEGNFHDEVAGSPSGLNILHLNAGFAELAAAIKMTEEGFAKKLEYIRLLLFEKRDGRIHPLKDDKILADWNGLMIAALARAGRALGEPAYVDAAKKAVNFVLTHLEKPSGRLLHRYRDGESAIVATLDDYACLTWGLLETYEATFESLYLRKALDLTAFMLGHFWDESNGGLFTAPDDATDLPIRQKEIYDGAIPSGNSIAMYNLLRLAAITGKTEFEEKTAAIARTFSNKVKNMPMAHTMFLCALDFAIGPSCEVVIEGMPGNIDTEDFLKPLRTMFLPATTVIFRDSSLSGDDTYDISGLTSPSGLSGSKCKAATAFVCRGKTCSAPTTSVEKMLSLLK
ncbi:MAG: thioredoxin domain-containing protein [Nitrospirae bacterium]|nr:thioredoxin domain-containing protein [Nitrospirota bacterium]